MDYARAAIVVLSSLSLVACAKSGKSGGNGGNGGAGSSDMTTPSLTNLTVTPAMAAIALAPGATSGSYTGTTALTAHGTDSSGAARDVTSSVTWSASDPSITVDGSGHVTATVVGSYPITATLGSQSATATVDVTLAAAASIGGFQGGD